MMFLSTFKEDIHFYYHLISYQLKNDRVVLHSHSPHGTCLSINIFVLSLSVCLFKMKYIFQI